MAITLTQEQQDILDGKQGKTKSKVMKTLIMYGETFGAEKMVPISGQYGHLVTSFGLSMMKPVFSLMDQLVDGGALSGQPFTVDPRPMDKNVPSNLLQKLLFKFMYSAQDRYEAQLIQMGLLNEDAFTCTCYLNEVGNKPEEGEILSWAESSAVVYANSVLGARCNRNSGIIEMFGNIVGCVPCFGFLTDEGRKATWIVEVRTTKKPEAQILGSAIGMKVMEDVPFIKGLNKWLGSELNETSCSYLKDMGAATASNGAVGLYHVEKLTPEAARLGEELINTDAKTYVIDDAELERVRSSYQCIWKNPEAEPKLCFIGCPHLTLMQLNDWTEKLCETLKKNGRTKVSIPTVFTAAPSVAKAFKETQNYNKLEKTGAILSYICPLMYMNNPLCGKMPVITNSNKLRTYSSSRFYTDEEILNRITKKEGK